MHVLDYQPRLKRRLPFYIGRGTCLLSFPGAESFIGVDQTQLLYMFYPLTKISYSFIRQGSKSSSSIFTLRLGAIGPGGRILDCRPVPDGEVGHTRFFVCFPLVLSINFRLGSLRSSWVGSPHDLKNKCIFLR